MIRRYASLIMSMICLIYGYMVEAQTVKGRIIDVNGHGLPGIQVSLKNTDHEAITNGSGIFRITNVKKGSYILQINDDDYDAISQTIEYKGSDLSIPDITVKHSASHNSKSDITVVDGDDLQQIAEDDDASFSSILTANRDAFDEAVAFNLSPGRFRARGYNNEDVYLYLNGMPVNDLDDGRVLFNSWGGLNDVMRSQTNVLTLRPSDFAFGGIGGSAMIDLRASVQRVQTKAVYTLSNRSYTHRLMLTHSTGLMKNGWGISTSLSRRWANSGYVAGTHYDSYSYFLSIDRKLNENHSLNLVFLGAPLRRGKASAETQEAYDIGGGNFYNPNWGYQAGEVRNSREDRINQPIAMLRHDAKITSKTKLTTTIGYQFGTYGNTRLDWYNAGNPAKDYYKNLPSYQLTQTGRDSVTAYFAESEANRQLDWNLFYEINKNRLETVKNANNSGESVTGNLSSYVLQEQRFDNTKLSFNSYFNSYLNQNISLVGGINYLKEKNHNFVILDDLLGGDFFLDVDDFAQDDFGPNSDKIQNDLNRINRLVKVGDQYDYDYTINTSQANIWGQSTITGDRIDVFLAGNVGNHSFYREGYTKNGKFPDNSFGTSAKNSFLVYGAKGGVTYKIDGRNYLYGVAGYRTRAPFSRFAYESPRTRDFVVDGLTTEKIWSAEAGYVFKYSGLQGRITGYVTDFKDQIDNATFFEETSNSFVSFTQTGIDKRHAGIEFGANAKLSPRWSIDAAVALGQYYYTSRPLATITRDLDGSLVGERNEVVYIKNYFVPGSPQRASSLGLNYNSPNFWFANLNFNYYAKNFLDPNPLRRMSSFLGQVSEENDPVLFHTIIDEEELPAQYTIDLFAGKSWRLNSKYFLAVNLSVGNILDNKEFRTGGFEQARFSGDIADFPSKYYYSYGRNFSLNFNLRM